MPPINTTRTGQVWIEEWDFSIAVTMGAFQSNSRYYLTVPGVPNPPFPEDWEIEGLQEEVMPGIPIIFAAPDERITDYILPCIVVRREDITPAPERWPSLFKAYRTPADGASAVQINWGQQTFNGYDKYEELDGPFPYDIIYLVSCLTSGPNQQKHAQKMIRQLVKIWPPRGWGYVKVTDDIGEERIYDALMEGPTSLKEFLDIVDRQSGYSLSITVKAELDHSDPEVKVAMSSQPTINVNEQT